MTRALPFPRKTTHTAAPSAACRNGARPPVQRLSFFPGLPVPEGLATTQTPARECPYLEGRRSSSRGFLCNAVPGWVHQKLMDAGFRRSGRVFYQNICPGCRTCTPIRVPVHAFEPSRSQRRLRRRNRDLTVSFGPPTLTDAKHRLYARYLAARHDGGMSGDREELEKFLYRSPTETLEVVYRDPAGRLAGVGICDFTPTALSSVYFYFEPEMGRRGLGTFSSLVEIDVAKGLGLSWYYPGFWVRGCPKMDYKSRFRPCELLRTDGVWRPFDDPRAPG